MFTTARFWAIASLVCVALAMMLIALIGAFTSTPGMVIGACAGFAGLGATAPSVYAQEKKRGLAK